MKILTEVEPKIKCSICHGTGIQEETVRGYRRYKCWSCEGKKVIDRPFANNKKQMKKRYTKFRILFSSENKVKAEKYFGKLKETDRVSIYRRKFKGKGKTRYYVREVVSQGNK